MGDKPEYRDAYKQLILFPVQAMANLHEMYYAQAMNLKLYAEGNPAANEWADKVEKAFARDKQLCDDYNHTMANGKWNGMMTQKHIGYTQWNDNFPADKLPEIHRVESPETAVGGYVFTSSLGKTVTWPWRQSTISAASTPPRPNGQCSPIWGAH